jgi:hypothetical protein
MMSELEDGGVNEFVEEFLSEKKVRKKKAHTHSASKEDDKKKGIGTPTTQRKSSFFGRTSSSNTTPKPETIQLSGKPGNNGYINTIQIDASFATCRDAFLYKIPLKLNYSNSLKTRTN